MWQHIRLMHMRWRIISKKSCTAKFTEIITQQCSDTKEIKEH